MKIILVMSLVVFVISFVFVRALHTQTAGGNPSEPSPVCQDTSRGPDPNNQSAGPMVKGNSDVPFEVQGIYPEIDQYITQGICPEWNENRNKDDELVPGRDHDWRS